MRIFQEDYLQRFTKLKQLRIRGKKHLWLPHQPGFYREETGKLYSDYQLICYREASRWKRIWNNESPSTFVNEFRIEKYEIWAEHAKEILSEIKAEFREVCALLDATLKAAQESSAMWFMDLKWYKKTPRRNWAAAFALLLSRAAQPQLYQGSKFQHSFLLKPPASGFLPHLCPCSRSTAWTLRQLLAPLDAELIILNFNYRAFPALSVKPEVHNGPFWFHIVWILSL